MGTSPYKFLDVQCLTVCRYDLGVIGGVVAAASFESTFKNPGANETYVYILSSS